MKYCGKCGEKYDDSLSFCQSCGMRLSQTPINDSNIYNKEPINGLQQNNAKNNNATSKLLKVFCCILVSVLILVIGSFISVGLGFKGAPIILLVIEFIIIRFVCKLIWNTSNIQDGSTNEGTNENVKKNVILKNDYYYMEGIDIVGPCTAEQIENLNLPEYTLVMKGKNGKWLKYENLKEQKNDNAQ